MASLQPLKVFLALSVVLVALLAVGRVSHLAELRGHLEGRTGVEASMTFNRGCARDIYYVLVDDKRGIGANHGSYSSCN